MWVVLCARGEVGSTDKPPYTKKPHASRGAAPGVRNVTLNATLSGWGRLIAEGELDRADIEQVLWAACEVNGLITDDGENQALRTIVSGLNVGMRRPRTRESGDCE
jgi:hypothetical protein